jgi:hypothetical protein
MRKPIVCLSVLVFYFAGAYIGPASACSNTFDVRSYGAAGDGATNDTAAVQAAINAAQTAGCGTVLGHKGDTYLVYQTGTQYAFGYGGLYPYSLAIPSNVTLNLQGGTLRLADNQNASIIVNADAEIAAGDQNISILNAHDGNGSNQGDPQDTAAILMYGLTNLTIKNVTTDNVRTVGIILVSINSSHFDKLSCAKTYGDCYEFGQTGNSSAGPFQFSNSVIGSMTAKNCVGGSRGRVGNSMAAVMINSTINTDHGEELCSRHKNPGCFQ